MNYHQNFSPSRPHDDAVYAKGGMVHIKRRPQESQITFEYSALPRDELLQLWKERQVLHCGGTPRQRQKSPSATTRPTFETPRGTHNYVRRPSRAVQVGYTLGAPRDDKTRMYWLSNGTRPAPPHTLEFPTPPERHNPWEHQRRLDEGHLDEIKASSDTPGKAKMATSASSSAPPTARALRMLDNENSVCCYHDDDNNNNTHNYDSVRRDIMTPEYPHTEPPPRRMGEEGVGLEALLDEVSAALMGLGTSLYDLRCASDAQVHRILSAIGYDDYERHRVMQALKSRYPTF
eukprot:PhM_4_TR11489/c0_g1_i1/m.27949